MSVGSFLLAGLFQKKVVVWWFFFFLTVAPVIVEPKEDDTPLSLKIGDPLNISCVAKGNPAPNVTWSNNNTGIAVSPTSTNSQRLIINSIEDKDFGFYTCIASNKLKDTMVSVEIMKGKIYFTCWCIVHGCLWGLETRIFSAFHKRDPRLLS